MHIPSAPGLSNLRSEPLPKTQPTTPAQQSGVSTPRVETPLARRSNSTSFLTVAQQAHRAATDVHRHVQTELNSAQSQLATLLSDSKAGRDYILASSLYELQSDDRPDTLQTRADLDGMKLRLPKHIGHQLDTIKSLTERLRQANRAVHTAEAQVQRESAQPSLLDKLTGR